MRRVAVGIALLAFLIWLLWPGAHRKAPSVAQAAPPAAPRVTPPAAANTPLLDDEDPAEEMLHAPSAIAGRPLLDGVDFSPRRLCAGQPFAINVRAHDPDGRDGELMYGVGNARGNPLVRTETQSGKHWLIVQAYNLRGDYDQRSVPIVVDDCGEEVRSLQVELMNAGAVGIAGLRAKLPADVPRASWQYAWDFGDGATATTTVPYVEHDYRGRNTNTTPMSTYLVKVTAHAADQDLSGMVAVPFMNLYAINRFHKGLIVPEVTITGSGVQKGVAFIEADIRHWDDQPIHLDRVVASHLESCDPQAAETAPQLDIAMLSPRTLVPGTTHVRLAVPEALVDGGCNLSLELSGPDVKGMPLHLFIGGRLRQDLRNGIAVGAPGTPGMDPRAAAMIQRVELAARLLGRDPHDPATQITDAELDRLEREGRIPPMPPPGE